jgi:hypothetical protein
VPVVGAGARVVLQLQIHPPAGAGGLRFSRHGGLNNDQRITSELHQANEQSNTAEKVSVDRVLKPPDWIWIT